MLFYKPGQSPHSELPPAHICPPWAGDGLVQFLLRVREPPPQLFVHPDHADQLDQRPWTATARILIIRFR